MQTRALIRRQTGTVSLKKLQDAFKKIYNDALRAPLLSCLATQPRLSSTFKCQMKYICNPKAPWITFHGRGVPLRQHFDNLHWGKCFTKCKKDLMHLNNLKERFASEYRCPSKHKVNTAN